MIRLRTGGALLALLLVALALNACTVQINSGSKPSPSASAHPKPTATPSPTPLPVSVVITQQITSGGCETSSDVNVLIDGHAVGTMHVDTNNNITTDRLAVMVTPVQHKYSLTGTAYFQSNGQGYGLTVTGSGQILVNPGQNSWTISTASSAQTSSTCPSQGTTWPLVVQA